MTDEMKLLMALCEALGFVVEQKQDYKEMPVCRDIGRNMIAGMSYQQNSEYTLKTDGNNAWSRGDDDGYIRKLRNPEISYKLTKKDATQ